MCSVTAVRLRNWLYYNLNIEICKFVTVFAPDASAIAPLASTERRVRSVLVRTGGESEWEICALM